MTESSDPFPAPYDLHVHVGDFAVGGRFEPHFVLRAMERLGMARWAVSSCSAAGEFSAQADAEVRWTVARSGGRAVPLLWVTREWLEDLDRNEREIRGFYRGFKLHPWAQGWEPGEPALNAIFRRAEAWDWPVLVHTGWTPESEAGRFRQLYADHPGATVVLAHARPLEQTIEVAQACPHVFVDTAYVSIADLRSLVDAGLEGRIVLGSDFPVDRHYFPGQSATRRYRIRWRELRESFGDDRLVPWGRPAFDAILGAPGGHRT